MQEAFENESSEYESSEYEDPALFSDAQDRVSEMECESYGSEESYESEESEQSKTRLQ
jgi:hypothetical protein